MLPGALRTRCCGSMTHESHLRDTQDTLIFDQCVKRSVPGQMALLSAMFSWQPGINWLRCLKDAVDGVTLSPLPDEHICNIYSYIHICIYR